jgi:hypothetical protein
VCCFAIAGTRGFACNSCILFDKAVTRMHIMYALQIDCPEQDCLRHQNVLCFRYQIDYIYTFRSLNSQRSPSLFRTVDTNIIDFGEQQLSLSRFHKQTCVNQRYRWFVHQSPLAKVCTSSTSRDAPASSSWADVIFLVAMARLHRTGRRYRRCLPAIPLVSAPRDLDLQFITADTRV